MASPAVQAERVSFGYTDTTVLRDVSFELPSGSITALLGPNGAGKTTFVRLVTGTVTPDEGTVTVLGDRPAAVSRERIGLLPQAFSPPERLTTKELLAYYAGLYRHHRDPEAVLADLGLVDAADQQYRYLSGGQQRRCCLGAALVNDPDVLILDEPTAGIDPAGKRTVWEYLPGLVDTGTSILITTHDMLEAERLADRVGLFHEGALLAHGPTDELVADRVGNRRLEIDTPDPDLLCESVGGTIDGDTVVINDVEADQLSSLISSAVGSDVTLRSLRWEHPPLEELFLTIAQSEDDQQ